MPRPTTVPVVGLGILGLGVKSTMKNYVLLFIITNQACTLQCTRRSKTQVDSDKAFLQWESNGTQIEQGLSGTLLFLPHSWKPSRISRYCRLPRIFVWGTRKRVGGNPKKFFATGKACGRQSTKLLFTKCSILTNWESFARESSQVLDWRSCCACDHAHPPRPRTTWNANSSENLGVAALKVGGGTGTQCPRGSYAYGSLIQTLDHSSTAISNLPLQIPFILSHQNQCTLNAHLLRSYQMHANARTKGS